MNSMISRARDSLENAETGEKSPLRSTCLVRKNKIGGIKMLKKLLKKEHQEIKRKEKGGENMLVQYYRYNNIIIQQIEQYDKWANVYILTDDDYRIATAIPRSTAEWLEQEYKQIEKEELVQELEARGYDAEEILF